MTIVMKLYMFKCTCTPAPIFLLFNETGWQKLGGDMSIIICMAIALCHQSLALETDIIILHICCKKKYSGKIN